MELTLRIRKRLGSRERDARSLRESRHWPISVELLIRTPIRLIGADSPTATHISASNGWEPVSFHLLNIKDKDGEDYDGAKTHQPSVSPNVPADQ
jgi:hypothetical protein